ncbi:hypothetical protein CBR_g41693 [Chara braunii]|uniref:RNA-directed DNA polymerase n=1 Tax=Chara braunii TaxID=69332 RepID=A0A388LWC3_CHABU|nr:hypothetical protein CBR_g41693 [Chara braunii]|eukprot:GBG86630.1 hypothetical protein CBR_g41693 [Chara braunii]
MERQPRYPGSPWNNGGRWEVSLPSSSTYQGFDVGWRAVTLGRDAAFMLIECRWTGMRLNRGPGDDLFSNLEVTGAMYLSEIGWHSLGVEIAQGHELAPVFQRVPRTLTRIGHSVRGRRNVGLLTRVEMGGWREFRAPTTPLRCRVMWADHFSAQSEGGQKDRESINPDGTKENRKEIFTGESSGKVGGSRQGTQGTKEGRNKDRTNPRNSEGAMPKKVRVTDTRRKLAEIDKRTAEYKARLIEEMMTGNEEGPLQEEPRDERKASQGGTGQGDKGSDHGGTPSKRRKEGENSLGMEAEKVTTPPAIDSRASRLPITPAVARGCEGLWSLRKRVLGWFDPEGTMKTREGQKDGKESPDNSVAGEASSSEGGLKKIVSSLARALNKNQGYLADAKKKLTFDGANITEFLIDYENLAALLKWTEEEKMDHLGQHVSLSLGRDIMVIVAASRSWKETRDVMMRKYLAAEKMATEADLAVVQRKNFATYNDFLREFTLVALRIPGVTDRIMSKYFLGQFFEFDKDKILSAYQQTSKFVNTRDVDFNTVTDLAEKTVVTTTLTLLKEGEIIDLTGRTGDKVKKGIESLHERVHGVDNKIERMEGALMVMQAQVSRPALPPQKAVVPPGVANRGFRRRDPANEQCKYCTAIGNYVRACPKLNHYILKRRCTRSLKGEIFGPQGERVNCNSPGGMRRVVIMLNGIEITVVEAEPVGEIIWDQLRGCGPQTNFTLESDGRDRVNATTRLGTAGRRINRDTIMEEVAGSSEPQAEPKAEEPEKVYGKPREEEPADKATTVKKKFRYQIPILTLPELDDTISKLLGTMVSVSFQTMLQASPRLLKGLRQLLTRRRVEIGDNPELPEGEREEEAPQEVANLLRSHGDLEDLERAFADIHLSLPDREGGEVMRSPPGTKLSFHTLPVGKLKIQIGSHHTDALVDGGAEITLIRRDFAMITGCTVNKEVTGSIRGAGGEIPFAGYVTKCAVKAGVRESICSFQRMTVMEEMDHDIILGRPWCANVEMIGMHLHDGSYMVDIEDPVTGRGELLRLLGTGGDPPKGKLATWSPSFEDSTRKGAFARMEGVQEKDETEVHPGIRRFVWDHLQDIKDILRRFLVYNITASGPNSILAVPEVTILGFRCGAYGRKPDPAKTDKISQWPTPLRKTTEVRAFLGVVGFWRIFIKNVAKIAEPIRAMIREEGTMDWTEKREGVVQRLKDILTSETVALSAPCFNDEVGRPFILETDGGPLAVGGVLIQRDEGGKERPIRFESRTLNSTEWRYSQFKKEVIAILHCLKTFQAYLFGRRFILRIDPTNVAGPLKKYRPIDPTVGRWVGFIWQFDYKIERIAEIRNKADGLSRVCITPEGMEDAEPIIASLEYEGGTLAVDNEMMSEGCTSGELLIQTLEKGAPAVVAELTEGPCVVNQMQEGKDGGKEGEEFFYVQSYEGLFREIGLLLVGNKQPTEVSIKAREEAERYILDARDKLSGFVEAIALKKKTGRSVADWMEDFYLRHSFVRRFIADNETEFVNQEVLGMLKRLCVPIKLIEPYHPEVIAPVERGHRTLKNMIAKLGADHMGNWPRYLKQLVFADNMTPKRTTGCIPAELWYGREIDFPVEALIPTWNRLDDDPQMTTEELIEARCQQILKNEEVVEDIASRVLDSRMRDKARWDQVKNVRREPLQVGEMVLLRNSTLESTWSRQLGRRFKGPYRVAKRVGLNTFELEDLDGTGLKGPFPGQRLVRFLSRDPVEQWLQEAEDKETEEPQVKD